MEIVFYPGVKGFVGNFDEDTVANATQAIELLEELGHLARMPHFKYLERDLFELRVFGRQSLRMIYTFHAGHVIILHAFIKKSMQIPGKELRIARQRLRAIDSR